MDVFLVKFRANFVFFRLSFFTLINLSQIFINFSCLILIGFILVHLRSVCLPVWIMLNALDVRHIQLLIWVLLEISSTTRCIVRQVVMSSRLSKKLFEGLVFLHVRTICVFCVDLNTIIECLIVYIVFLSLKTSNNVIFNRFTSFSRHIVIDINLIFIRLQAAHLMNFILMRALSCSGFSHCADFYFLEHLIFWAYPIAFIRLNFCLSLAIPICIESGTY